MIILPWDDRRVSKELQDKLTLPDMKRIKSDFEKCEASAGKTVRRK